MLSKPMLALAAGLLGALPATAQGVEAEAEADAGAQVDAAASQAQTGATALAEPADFRTGAAVRDTEGGLVGTIESVDAEGAVVSTGRVRARLPFGSFGKNARGLVITLTRAELEAAARAESEGS